VMRIERDYIANVSPTQPYLRHSKKTLERIKTRFLDLPPVTSMEYLGRKILGDGHHRIMAALMLGLHSVDIKIIETDREMMQCFDGVFRPYNSLAEFASAYEEHFWPLCQINGIRSFQDFLI
jgi:hypothetical protein